MDEIKPETKIEQLKSELIMEKIKRKRIQAQLDLAEDYISDLEEIITELGMESRLDGNDDDDDYEDSDIEEEDDE